MFSPPQISTNKDLSTRSFIFFYHNKKRYKFYNGNRLNIPIHPNHSKTIRERDSLLKKLQFEYHKALSTGWSPIESDLKEEKKEKQVNKVKPSFENLLAEKLKSPYSKTYKRDLIKLCEQFIEFLPIKLLEADINDIPLPVIEQFLNQFKSSGRHYMNKRLLLSVFFSEFVRKDYLAKNPVNRTSRQKIKAKLHDVYTEEQLKEVFGFLKINHYNLYLCALITYGCLLRPHQEVRILKRKHINEDYSKIYLSGDENKSGRVRTVYIPPYLQSELKTHLKSLDDAEANIFTLDSKVTYNDDYFKTQWSRAKMQMVKGDIISVRQTLYSFRHTAAVTVYRKTKDLNILQQLLGHSNMIVTLKYLRGLGEATNEDLIDSLPELDLT